MKLPIQKCLRDPLLVCFIIFFLIAAGCKKPGEINHSVAGDTVQDDGFVKIFDGKTLAGWEGDPTYWRVENGSLVGEITPATTIKSNTFIIRRRGRPQDF